ncbi:MAG: DNA polymerase III subunit gamma/tau [Stappiaceae bacterium]
MELQLQVAERVALDRIVIEPGLAASSMDSKSGDEQQSDRDDKTIDAFGDVPQSSSADKNLQPDGDSGYRVLARKYRPQNFDDLYGQEAMVQTLSNAFESGRIAQAWMLTGVRGVGKTTTARILARGLNYEIPGEIEQPTIRLDKPGVHCQAIMEGRHVDVIEMDAASHTGINDIREITDAARYRPATARYKVYIIDEVHMLSNAAFNGLLKTLEEPPEHVKFIFATTEIRKVPVTVLSRCQRFDLRRIDAEVLVQLMRRIADAEKIDISDEALSLIARAGEGSARDSLSLLDQGIAHGAGHIDGDTVRSMLGLADRARVIDLFEHIMRGNVSAAMDELQTQYQVGADPAVILTDLAEFVHLVTRLKIVPSSGDGAAVTEQERQRGLEFAQTLSIRILSRAWQILLKGIPEVQAAPKPLSAADMVLVRLCYAADLPSPEEALKKLQEGSISSTAPVAEPPQTNPIDGPVAEPRDHQTEVAPPKLQAVASTAGPVAVREPLEEPAPEPQDEPVPVPAVEIEPPSEDPGVRIRSLEEAAALAGEKRDIRFKVALETQVRLVSFEPGRIEMQPTEIAPPGLAGDIGRKLTDWTGERWVVVVSREEGGPTLKEIKEAKHHALLTDAAADPSVAAILKTFPGAKIIDVKVLRNNETEDILEPVESEDDDD